MIPKVLYSFFIVIIITIKDTNQEVASPLFQKLPTLLRMLSEKANNENRLQKRESDPDVMSDPEGRAGIQDLAGQTPFGQFGSALMDKGPKEMILGTFQVVTFDAPKLSDMSNGLQGFQGLLSGGGGGSK